MRDGQIVIRDADEPVDLASTTASSTATTARMFLQDVKALLEDPTLMFMEMV